MLCERGIRTFETAYRFTLDLMAVPVLKELSHLPVIVDPSHAAGRRDLVMPLSLAAAAAGADGLIVEVHPNPDQAICDGPQQLVADEFADYVERVQAAAAVAGKALAAVCRLAAAFEDRRFEDRARRRRADRRLDRAGRARAARRHRHGLRHDRSEALEVALAAGRDRSRRREHRRRRPRRRGGVRRGPRGRAARGGRRGRSNAAPAGCVVTRRRLDQAGDRRARSTTPGSWAAIRWPEPRPPASSTPAPTCSTAPPGTSRRPRRPRASSTSGCTASCAAWAPGRWRSSPRSTTRSWPPCRTCPTCWPTCWSARRRGRWIAGRPPERLPATGPSFRDATRVAGASSRDLDRHLPVQPRRAGRRNRRDDRAAAAGARGAGRRRRRAASPRGTTARPTDRRRLLEAQLAGGPLFELRASVPNRPGVVAQLALELGRAGVNITDMALYPAPGHERRRDRALDRRRGAGAADRGAGGALGFPVARA